MKYRHVRNFLRRWAYFLAFALVIFCVIFFIRQNGKPLGKVGFVSNLRCDIVKKFSFSDKDALKEWEEKIFKDRVIYRIEKDNVL